MDFWTFVEAHPLGCFVAFLALLGCIEEVARHLGGRGR
jgi:hypothetical protein